MAFVDDVRIFASSGKGGDGVVRWIHNYGNAKGGPGGGDGGRGGDVFLLGVRDLAALANYRYEKKFLAEPGEDGGNELCRGANGKSVYLKVPVGTVVRVIETWKEIEITKEGEEVLLFEGGTGGKGNARFKSATNQNPFEQTNGRPAQSGELQLTLKIIADAGLVGLPNAGKSSLLNALTRAKSKVGAYAFTTLEPNLGDFYGYVLADIPGLIEGASSGKGLGIKFLKHVERTGILLHLVSASQEDLVAAYREVRSEIEQFGHGLSEKREVVVLSKTDLCTPEEVAAKRAMLEKETGKEVLTVSIEDADALKAFSDTLTALLKKG